jgi:hypothetical protein
MPRTVFFSFHYDRDIMRVQVVKQHYITKGTYTAAGYFDGSLEEVAKKKGDQAVVSLINKGMAGASVLCVLIGAETFQRRWVHYEIFKAIELGMGIFGIRINQIAVPKIGKDLPGTSPFDVLGYGRKDGKLRPMHFENGVWCEMPYNGLLSGVPAPYLEGKDRPGLGELFRVYDWVSDNGFANFGGWVEAAAKQAGK